MPTLVGARRRGFTAEGFRLMAERIGVSKADSWIDMSVLEDCMRDDLNARAQRRIAVLDPVKLVIDNYPEGQSEDCFAPNHPQRPELGRRALPLTRELWIERDDYTETPPKGYFRLTPGAEVRLRYGYIVKCTGADKDADGNVTTVHCTYDPDTRSGTPGADARKVKGNIHWLSAGACRACGGAHLRSPVQGAVSRRAQPVGIAHRRRDRGAVSRASHGGRGRRRRRHGSGRAQLPRRPQPRVQARARARSSSPHSRAPRRRSASSSSGTAISSPISRTTRPGPPVFNRSVTLKDSWSTK